jgi:glycosyltransferase involved in cell wall biosynthesis
MSGSIAVSSTKGLVGLAASSRSASGDAQTMSVAIYLHDLSGGGVERQSLIIAEEFRRHGADVTLVVHRLRGQLLDQVPAGLRIIDLAGSRTLHDIPRLARFLRTEQPDILLANVDFNNVAALLAKAIGFARTKIVICQHNPLSSSFVAYQNWPYRYISLFYRLLAPLIDQAVAVSAGVADELVALGGVKKDRVVTINNPVVGPDFEARCNETVEHPWFNQPGRPVFVTAGRMVPQKGHDTMLQALAIHRQTSDSRLILLGTGPLQAELRSLADQLGLSEVIDFHGFHGNALPFFRQADAFLLSSFCEGFGNVIVEAMGCGTPVISTRCSHGPAEILDDGRFGLLVEPHNPPALAAAMNQVSTLRDRFPAEVLRHRAAEYSYAACASRYMAVFSALAPNRAWVA